MLKDETILENTIIDRTILDKTILNEIIHDSRLFKTLQYIFNTFSRIKKKHFSMLFKTIQDVSHISQEAYELSRLSNTFQDF